jgi:hypothetical protein
MFSYKSSIGGIYGNYEGTIMSFRNFMDYHSTLSTYYMIVQSTNTAINRIHQTVTANHHMYISTKYSGILPQKLIETRAYTSNQGVPVSFVTSQSAYVPGIPPISMSSIPPTTTGITAPTVRSLLANSVHYPSPATSLGPSAASLGPVGLSYADGISVSGASGPSGLTDLSGSTGASFVSVYPVGPTGISYTTLSSDNSLYNIGTYSSTGPSGSSGMTGMSGMTGIDPACINLCCSYINNLINKWYANLPVNSVIGTLVYRLGLVQVGGQKMQYNIVSTILNYTSTQAINFFMQINDEQGFNNMDVAMNENYSQGNDTTGQIKLVAAKILMGNVGDSGISQTLIQNPSIFENTLGKLDKLNIKIYYDDGPITPAWLYLPFQYEVNEWDATFQIDEEVGFINQDEKWKGAPSVPIPTNPNETPYLYYTKKPDEK